MNISKRVITIVILSLLVISLGFGLIHLNGKLNNVINGQTDQIELKQTYVNCVKEQKDLTDMIKTLKVAYNLSEYESKYYSIIFRDFAKKYNIEWEIYPAFVKVESHYNPKAHSSAGAKGLTQVLEGTAKQVCKNIGIKYKNNNTLWNDIHNLAIGLTYFSEGFIEDTTRADTSSLTHAISRYNGGPGYAKNMRKNEKTRGMIKDYREKVWNEFYRLKYIHMGVKADG